MLKSLTLSHLQSRWMSISAKYKRKNVRDLKEPTTLKKCNALLILERDIILSKSKY